MTPDEEAALMACYDDLMYRAACRHGIARSMAHEKLWTLLPRASNGWPPFPLVEALRWAEVEAMQGWPREKGRAHFLAALRSHFAGEAAEAAS